MGLFYPYWHRLRLLVISSMILQEVDVEYYSGHKAHECPTVFTFEGQRREVVEVMDRWYGGSP